jgi:hypothetical protein
MVEDAGSVDNLPLGVLVLAVTNKQILSCKCVWLNVHVCIGDVVDERGFTDVWETGYNQGSSVSVDLWQTGEMLPYFFQVGETRLQFLEHRAGATQCSAFQHFAPIQGIGVLKKTHVVVRNVVNDAFCLVYVTKGELVMVAVVEHVHQISIKGMYIVQFWEALNDGGQLFCDDFLHVLYLTHIEFTNALDFEAGSDDCGSFPLSFAETDINKFVCCRYLDDGLEIVAHLI